MFPLYGGHTKCKVNVFVLFFFTYGNEHLHEGLGLILYLEFFKCLKKNVASTAYFHSHFQIHTLNGQYLAGYTN